MKRFQCPLSKRLREARYRRLRYASDPEWRLKIRNYQRARSGLGKLASVEEIGSANIVFARQRERDERGRFI